MASQCHIGLDFFLCSSLPVARAGGQVCLRLTKRLPPGRVGQSLSNEYGASEPSSAAQSNTSPRSMSRVYPERMHGLFFSFMCTRLIFEGETRLPLINTSGLLRPALTSHVTTSQSPHADGITNHLCPGTDMTQINIRPCFDGVTKSKTPLVFRTRGGYQPPPSSIIDTP